MGIRKQGLSCAEARAIDMVGFLAGLGFQPSRVRGNQFWYCSPLREERTPSFKINSSINRWYDFGTGQGGSLIDFGMLYYQCDLPAFLLLLQHDLSFPRAVIPELSQVHPPEPKLIVTSQSPLSAPSLIGYLQQRKIAAGLARQYCCEVRYRINDRPYFGIGFQNDSGGYEIRNARFKGSSSPKDYTLVKKEGNRLCVLEGFMDFLSWLTLFPQDQNQYDFLVLNSLAFFEKARPVIEAYQQIHLYLDNDTAGKQISSYALSLSPQYSNCDQLYQGYEDLSDFLCQKPLPGTADPRPP
nr:toprim domain-containing protein [Pedobacter sp. ASV19]